MSSEASRTGFGSDTVGFHGAGAIGADSNGWYAVERRVLMSKLQALEERASRLDYLETRLRDLNSEVQRLTRLADATHTLNTTDDIGQLVDTAMTKCLELLQAECASLCLLEPGTDELVVVKAHGASHAALEGSRVRMGQGVVGYVALRREPVHVVDIERDGRFPTQRPGRYATRSFVSVPLVDGDGVLGVLNMADRRDRRPFDQNDLRTALRLAQDVATAVARVRRLEASQSRQRQFVSKLTHELRNPLDGVLRFINLTLAGAQPDERRRRYLMASKNGIERLTGIVNSLTGSYRHATPSEEPVQVSALLHQAVQLQEGKAEQRAVAVDVDVDDGLPPVRGGNALFQVFTNLISNAYDAMQEGGGTLKVSGHRENGSIVVRVADTGSGMPTEMLERIFAPFYTTKAPGKGMGLGLAVCREVVNRLNGQIDVSSEPGNGTAFTVSVPYVKTQRAARS